MPIALRERPLPGTGEALDLGAQPCTGEGAQRDAVGGVLVRARGGAGTEAGHLHRHVVGLVGCGCLRGGGGARRGRERGRRSHKQAQRRSSSSSAGCVTGALHAKPSHT